MKVADESGDVKWVRTIRRVPIQTRWEVANLEWVRHIPWNTAGNDPNAEGEQSSFDFKAGPGVKTSAEDIEGVLVRDASSHQLPHRTHRFKKDFDTHGYTDRCPGCSSVLRDAPTAFLAAVG